MLSIKELEWLSGTLKDIDGLLRGLSDFRAYPELLHRDDEAVQSLLERIVHSVQNARLLGGKALERIDGAREDMAEADRQEAQAAREAAIPAAEATPTVRIVRPPANIEQILMANPTGMRELVLVADPDPASLQATETILTDEDYRVLSVRDAFEAISIYARLWAAIDMVILDFSMPGLSGDLVFDELKAINPNVAVVISGGYTHPEKLSQMLGQGLSGFLPKPFTREKFLRQIQQVLAHRPLMRA